MAPDLTLTEIQLLLDLLDDPVNSEENIQHYSQEFMQVQFGRIIEWLDDKVNPDRDDDYDFTSLDNVIWWLNHGTDGRFTQRIDAWKAETRTR